MKYPDKIASAVADLVPIDPLLTTLATAVGTAASFTCGSFVRLEILVSDDPTMIERASFRSNGCGFLLASADRFTRLLRGMRLTDMNGLHDQALTALITKEFAPYPAERLDCVATCIDSLRAAMLDLRSQRVSEFHGDSPLICSCFGVSEDAIERAIVDDGLETVEEVAGQCNAGSGCGSCRMVIEEMISAVEIGRL